MRISASAISLNVHDSKASAAFVKGAGPPATTGHVECAPAERAARGIPEGLVRYSVAIEDPGDLIADPDKALSGLGNGR